MIGSRTRVCLALVASLVVSTIAGAETKAYVADSAAGTVLVIDTTTRAVVATVAVGLNPGQIAVAPDGAHVYVTLRGSNAVAVLDGSTNTLQSSIAVDATPRALALRPGGQELYVELDEGVVDIVDLATGLVSDAVPIVGTGQIAFTPDGTRAYVAATNLEVIDSSTHGVTELPIGTTGSLAISPDGRRVFVSTPGPDIFSGDDLTIVDEATNTISRRTPWWATLGDMAFTPDGSRVYVGDGWRFVDTGYGEGFFPGSTVLVFDGRDGTFLDYIDLGRDGAVYTQQNVAGAIAVTPDRSDVYITIPRLGAVAVAPVNTNVVAASIPVGAGPAGLAITPDANATLVPYALQAADEAAPVSIPSDGGAAIDNVLANDSVGGIGARLSMVTLSQLVTSDPGFSLDPATGRVTVAAGTPLGDHSLTYEVCENGNESNCASAVVTATVREGYLIDAADVATTARAGSQAIANLLADAALGGLPATTATVKLSVVSSSANLVLNTSTGQVFVNAATPAGTYALVYQICEIASLANCDAANVSVTVLPLRIDAVNDTGTITQSGGVAVANVLANDAIDGVAANTGRVAIAAVSSSSSAIALSATGAISIAAGAAIGSHTLRYEICEVTSPSNCGNATVSVNVTAHRIDTADDSARASSKTGGTAISNVLANDRLAGAVATLSTVRLSLVSAPPAGVTLDVSTGAVAVSNKTQSGLYTFRYQICEKTNSSNCGQANITLDLSGKGK